MSVIRMLIQGLWLYSEFSVTDELGSSLCGSSPPDCIALPEALLKNNRAEQEPCFLIHGSRLVAVILVFFDVRELNQTDRDLCISDSLHPFFWYTLVEPVRCTSLDLAHLAFFRGHVSGWLSNSRVCLVINIWRFHKKGIKLLIIWEIIKNWCRIGLL